MLDNDCPLPMEQRGPSYLRLVPSLSMQQAQEIWQAATVTNRHALIAYCLGWNRIVPWTADAFHAFSLIKQVEIFWRDRFDDALYAITAARTGLRQVSMLDTREVAYHLGTLFESACDHLEDVGFAFVYAHPKGCAALQAYSEHINRMEAL
jgi:hypothetical protein